MLNKNKKYFIIIILFVSINYKLFPLIYFDGLENEIITGKIIFRERYMKDNGFILENKYYVIFDSPWTVKVFDKIDMTFNELLIANDISELIENIDYKNIEFKILCSLGVYHINTEEGFVAIIVKNIEFNMDK
jgi:hypothetical protein